MAPRKPRAGRGPAGLLTVYSPLPRSFYARPALVVARASIGQLLVHDSPEGLSVGRIVECEAYAGPDDRAAHSFGGRRTARTEVMFGSPGFAYVFLVYGLHVQFNLVCAAPDVPEAVLVRAIEPVSGSALMAARRGMSASKKQLCNGPGKLCRALGITMNHYGEDLCQGKLYLSRGSRSRINTAPRIGIDYAGEWAKRPWRFFDPDSQYVSVAPKG